MGAGEFTDQDFADLVRAAFARTDWLVPFVEASAQYRAAYYGLNAAALLEDVFFDALANYAARFRPEVEFVQTPRGAKGDEGDYVVGGLTVSHKVQKKPSAIAVLWDATASLDKPWSSDAPVAVVLSEQSRVKGDLLSSGGEKVGTARQGYPPLAKTPATRVWAVVRWARSGDLTVERFLDGRPESWSAAWSVLGSILESGAPANEIELLEIPRDAMEGVSYSLAMGLRPGVYLLPKDLLTGIKLEKNNRGLLIPAATVTSLMTLCLHHDTFVPMPTWPSAYAGPRPPDLFLAQRFEFDRRFSPAGRVLGLTGEPDLDDASPDQD